MNGSQAERPRSRVSVTAPPGLIGLLRADYARVSGRRLTTVRGAHAALLAAPFRTALLHRLASTARSARVGRTIAAVNLVVNGADIDPRAQIGAGVLFAHPVGTVIGGGSRIGARCTLMGGVTLGQRRFDAPSDTDGYPTLGDDVTLGTRASVLGDIRVGDGVTVGAHSLVLHDVAPGTTVAGTPASVRHSRRG